ncbi:EH domain-containing protein 2 [Nymphaea thermarum]|nr:EH domain-containing protein 2 [Nymphaea thermarum]
MARRDQAPNMDLFDLYFRRADLDQDGRISGNEAVAFFQGSNLPKHILAQIWMHADQNQTGFLGRLEFYNALKLVTVAQSGRELTPDIVKAALGPASAKIPPPQISTGPAPVPQVNAVAPSSVQMNVVRTPGFQMNTVTQTVPQINPGALPVSHNPGIRGPQPPNNLSQQFAPSFDNQFMRPPAGQISSIPAQGIKQNVPPGSMTGSHIASSNISADWVGNRTINSTAGATSQVLSRGIVVSSAPLDALSALTPSIPPQASQDMALSVVQPMTKDSKSVHSGKTLSLDSIFGGDVFSATPSQPKLDIVPSPTLTASNVSNSSALVPVTSSGVQTSGKQGPDMIQSSLTNAPAGGHLQQDLSLVKQSQIGSQQTAPVLRGSGISVGVSGPVSNLVQTPWPKITQSDIQRYNAIFVEVDTDRDGKITGEQARNLFLSWRLPREVLKQVWDLSDQDNDSMLSVKEFCTALYLMERYREGRPLPAVLPDSMKFDEAFLPAVNQHAGTFGGAAWRPTHGIPQQMASGTHPVAPAAGPKATGQYQMPPSSDGANATQPLQQKSKVPVLEKHLVNQLSQEEQTSLNSKCKEATESEKKVEELEKEILESKEKIEFYRAKMQELVLYKSRCDNRLNEITERASADKREVESLAKKYEEKYKHTGDVASKLTVEEATFREIQEKKLEIYRAIVKMEQGGTAVGVLQARADKIQSDLEELVRSLKERCKRYGLRVKPTVIVELPSGWQPGIQEDAAEWDDDWDKFEDEGFTIAQELTVEEAIAATSAKPTGKEEFSAMSISNFDSPVEKLSAAGQHVTAGGSAYPQSEDESTKSGPFSPAKGGSDSPPQEFSASQYDESIRLDSSPTIKDNQSNHHIGESTRTSDMFGDESSWAAAFNDENDDVDSVWGFNAVSSKDPDHGQWSKDSFFESDDMGLNPIRTGSPGASSSFEKKEKSPFLFGDSVPGTPSFNSNSPTYSVSSEDHQFGSTYTKFDSFSMQDNTSPRHNATFARFDSIRSTSDFDHSHGFSSFDDTDLFGTTGPFKSDNSTPRKRSDNWNAF